MNSLEYTEDIGTKIISLLDNWVIETPVTPNSSNVNPFLSEDTTINPNKKVSNEEVKFFFELNITKALSYTNRLNISDLEEANSKYFIDGVCYWTASDLWQKYNIRVSNEDLEDQYIQSYGGLLFGKGKEILNSFILQRITSYHKKKKQINPWII